MEGGNKGGDSSPPPPASSTPAKKLARQLDFTAYGGASAREPPATSAAQLTPQTRPQPEPVIVGPLLQAQTVAQTAAQSSMRVVKPESPKARPQSNIDAKDGTPKRQKQCNCKHSRCLKLYCECFASGVYCDGCNCNNCCNNVENEAARREAVEATLERNPNAFRPKIASSPYSNRDNRDDAGEVMVKHNKGCHCKKSGCLKKYCECFQANILCSDNCRCIDCKNFEGSEERLALFHGEHANSLTHMHQAANAAITGAIGSSGFNSTPVSRKRRGQELYFGPTSKDPSVPRVGQFEQANQVKPSGLSSAVPSTSATGAVNSVSLGASKFTYRSLLADIIQPQDVKELCSVLVVLSEEVAKTIAETSNVVEKQTEDGQEISQASSPQGRLQGQEASSDVKTFYGDSASGDQTDKICSDESNIDGNDVPKSRPMSPLTLALRCDEQDTMFMTAGSPNVLASQVPTTFSQSAEQCINEVYAEQERIVLTKFRDCLNRLITFGELKETKCSSLARCESFGQIEPNTTSGAKSRTDGLKQPPPVTNGVLPATRTPEMVGATITAVSTNDLFSRNLLPPKNGDVKPNI